MVVDDRHGLASFNEATWLLLRLVDCRQKWPPNLMFWLVFFTQYKVYQTACNFFQNKTHKDLNGGHTWLVIFWALWRLKKMTSFSALSPRTDHGISWTWRTSRWRTWPWNLVSSEKRSFRSIRRLSNSRCLHFTAAWAQNIICHSVRLSP